MKKILTIFFSLGLIALVIPVAFAQPPQDLPNNGNSHGKATGTVTWTARTHLPPAGQLTGLVTSFDAHDEAPGEPSDRGTLETMRPADDSFSGGSIVIDLECVNVDGDQAWMAGTATEATGGYTSELGNTFLYWVLDDATPGADGDLIGGRKYPSNEAACSAVESGSWTGSGVVTDGNLVVHDNDSEESTTTPTEEPSSTPTDIEPTPTPTLPVGTLGTSDVLGTANHGGDHGNNHEKATGDVGYEAVGLQRWGEFDVHEREAKEMHFDLLGDWIIEFDFGSIYTHDMTVENHEDGEFEATGGYPSPGPYSHEWEATGTVDGYDVEITITYLTGNPGYEVYMTGMINTDGSMSGSCTTSADQSCLWSTSSGKANLNGQKGVHHYSDANGGWYDVDVSKVNVDDDHAYYTGEVVLASSPGWIGNWFNGAVLDAGTPGSEGDSIWGIFTDESTAETNVNNAVLPGTEYPITSGNLVVHSSE